MNLKAALFLPCVLLLAAGASDCCRAETVTGLKQSPRQIVPRDGYRALFANDTFADLETFVIYLLQRDEVVQTKYYFPQKHVKGAVFLEDFARVEEALRQKFGAPAKANEIWRSGHPSVDSDPARMIAVGELTLRSQWETADLIIVHSLQGEHLDIDHEINYISKRVAPVATEIMREIRPKHFF